MALEDGLRRVDALFDRFAAGPPSPAPGLVYGVVANGSLAHVRGIGTLRAGEDAPPQADSVFRIASMTKSFTAAVASRGRRLSTRTDPRAAASLPRREAGARGPEARRPLRRAGGAARSGATR